MKIKKFNEAYEVPESKIYTAGHLMDLLRKVPIDTPIVIVNAAGRGTSDVQGNIMVVTDDIYYSKQKGQYLQQSIPEEEALEDGFVPVEKAVCIFSN